MQDEKKKIELSNKLPEWFKFFIVLVGLLYPDEEIRKGYKEIWNKRYGFLGKIS